MSDPERLTRRAPSTTAGALMRAGLTERASDVSVQRTLKAVAAFTGLGTAPGGAALAAELARDTVGGAAGLSGAPSVALTAPALIAKWFAVGAGSGVLLSIGVHHAVAPAGQAPPRPVAHVSARPAPTSVRARLPAAARVPPATELEASLAPAAPDSTHVPAAALNGPATDVSTPDATAAELALEVALVDRARALLSADDARAALVALQGYEAQSPKRQLYTEVLALRMEASHALGDEAEAKSLATRLLARDVARPLADRARHLLAE
jgi:hypothetical protein